MKALEKKYAWSKTYAYVVGLLATDGNLSIDGRHINFTTKDRQLARLFKKYLNLKVKIGKKSRAANKEKKYFVVQFGSVQFYRRMIGIGITPRKSKSLDALEVPQKYFYDFFRGCIDGDGSIGVYKHPESSRPQLRVRLVSASPLFLEWVNRCTARNGISGYFTKSRGVTTLAFAKKNSTKLLNLVYYAGFPKSLHRKYKIAKKYADVV